jgi:hypothetical protein
MRWSEMKGDFLLTTECLIDDDPHLLKTKNDYRRKHPPKSVLPKNTIRLQSTIGTGQ